MGLWASVKWTPIAGSHSIYSVIVSKGTPAIQHEIWEGPVPPPESYAYASSISQYNYKTNGLRIVRSD